MKKIFPIAAASLMILAATPSASAQSILDKAREKAEKSFLEKAKEKAESAAKKVANDVADRAAAKAIEIGTEKAKEKAEEKLKDSKFGKVYETAKSMESGNALHIQGGSEMLQPKRSSTLGWSGPVTPSTAKFPIMLMNEFPALPTAAQIANPTEADQIAFYKAITAVTLRAEELNSDTTCADEMTEEWRKRYEKTIQDAFGFTDAEMALLNKNDLTEAEQNLLSEKIALAMFGVSDPQAELAKAGNIDEMDRFAVIRKNMEAVYTKHDAGLRKYFGSSAQEQKEITELTFTDEKAGEKRAKEFEKRAEAYMKQQAAANPGFEAEAKAFEKAYQADLIAATKSAMGPALGLGTAMGGFENKLAPIKEMQQKALKYTTDMAAAFPESSIDFEIDAKFAKTDKETVEKIKKEIYKAPSDKIWNPMFQRAENLIKTYRERAAKVWIADVQKRFEAVKAAMPEIIKINRQAIADGIIPECALYRTPLNAVINAGEILAEAYSEFPCDYPPMYIKEKEITIILGDSESCFWYPEFFITTDLESILAGKHVKKQTGTAYYSYDNGKWTLAPGFDPDRQEQKKSLVSGGTWTSSDGKRTVIYNAEGGFLQLPEGDIVYPLALQRTKDGIDWAEQEFDENGNLVIYRCTYRI